MRTERDMSMETLHEVKDALKDLLENAELTKSQRKKIEDLLDCETEAGFRSLAAKYNIGISYDEDNVYVTFYGKNEEFEKPKALMGKKTPWKRFFPQSSQQTETRPSGSRSFDDLIAQLEAVDPSTIEIERDTSPEEAFNSLIEQLRRCGVNFPRPLVNVIRNRYMHVFSDIVFSSDSLKDGLIQFFNAFSDYFRRVVAYGRDVRDILELPEGYTFEEVLQFVIGHTLRMLKNAGIKDPERYIYLDCREYNLQTARTLIRGILTGEVDVSKLRWISKSVLIAVPIHRHAKHVMVINTSERFWKIPARWAEKKLRVMENVVRRAYSSQACMLHPSEIRERTYILIGRWPDWLCKATHGKEKRYVKKFARFGLSTAKKGLYVYNGKKGTTKKGGYFSFDYVEMLWKHIHKFYHVRYARLLRCVKGTPYGTIAEMLSNFRTYLEYLELCGFRFEEVPPVSRVAIAIV